MTMSAGLALLFSALAASNSTLSSETVARLVEQLAAPALQSRQEAARQIEGLGPAVLPLLPDASTVESPAARDALELLRQRLERRLETETTQASLVTLNGRHSFDEVLAALRQQTSNLIRAEPAFATESRMDVDWQAVPFWTAVADLERQTDRQMRWPRLAEQFQLIPVTRPSIDLAVAVSGPFRMAVRTLESRETDVQRLARFQCVLQAEPRLQPLFVQWPLRDWTLQTAGEPVDSWNPDAVFELPFPDGAREVALAVDFPHPQVELPREWTLRGRCTVHLAAGRESLGFAGSQLRRGATLRRGGVTAQIRMVRFEAPQPESLEAMIRIVVNYDRGGPAFESHRLGLFQRSAWLESDTGERSPYSKLEVVAEADGGLAIEYHFQKLTAPASRYRFVYEAPTLLLEVPVAVRLSAPASR